MKQETNQEELAPLAHCINEQYEGDYYAISHYISNAIYMLHYLPEDDFETKERQDVCFALHQIITSLYQAYRRRHVKNSAPSQTAK